jgi:hypothetical protein
MLYEALVLLQYAPKVTMAYVGFAFLYGIAINNWILGLTLFLDIFDFVPLD